jgi:hypothetical protein
MSGLPVSLYRPSLVFHDGTPINFREPVVLPVRQLAHRHRDGPSRSHLPVLPDGVPAIIAQPGA